MYLETGNTDSLGDNGRSYNFMINRYSFQVVGVRKLLREFCILYNFPNLIRYRKLILFLIIPKESSKF